MTCSVFIFLLSKHSSICLFLLQVLACKHWYVISTRIRAFVLSMTRWGLMVKSQNISFRVLAQLHLGEKIYKKNLWEFPERTRPALLAGAKWAASYRFPLEIRRWWMTRPRQPTSIFNDAPDDREYRQSINFHVGINSDTQISREIALPLHSYASSCATFSWLRSCLRSRDSRRRSVCAIRERRWIDFFLFVRWIEARTSQIFHNFMILQ